MTERVGTVLDGKYELVAPIGRGGMGAVYAARHVRLGRRVAVKLLKRELAARPGAVERFEREARAACRIEHDNVCEVLDVGETAEGDRFYVMPLLRGRSLSAAIRDEGPLPVERACDLALQILSALEAAHAVGVVHRDLKPGNVFLTSLGERRDFVKVLDFGISKMAAGEGEDTPEPLTQTGSLLGTPHYMAPEQARGARDLDGRVDLYAVGVILYEMLTGRRPFEGESSNQVLWSIWNEPVTPPRAHRREIPRPIEEVVLRALARDGAERYPDAASMGDALAVALARARAGERPTPESVETVEPSEGAPTLVDEASIPTPPVRGPSRSRGLGFAAVAMVWTAAALLLLFAFGRSLGGGGEPSVEAEPARARPRPAGQAPGPDASAAPAGASAQAALPEPASVEAAEPSPARIVLSGVPPGARVAVDGGQVTDGGVEVDPAREKVVVTVEAEGYQPWRREVPVAGTTAVEVRLRRAGGEPSRRPAPRPGLVPAFGAVP